MRRVLAAFGVALLLGGLVPVQANHTQNDSGKSIVFDHKTGNDYWVEVVLGGAAASSVVRVDVQDETNRVWHPLEKKSWGSWAGSYAFPPGEEVRFRATFGDGVQAVSCWFTHPAGTEMCDNPPPPAGWATAKAFTTGSMPDDLGIATGDLDRDTHTEVYVPTREGLVAMERNDAGAWTSTLVTDRERTRVLVADLDGDRRPEVYSSGRSGVGTHDLVLRHEWVFPGWQTTVAADLPYPVRSMTVGNWGDGDVSLYVGTSNGFGEQPLYRVDFDWQLPDGVQLVSADAAPYLAFGDATRDGIPELWAAGYNGDRQAVYRIERDATGGYNTQLQFVSSTDQEVVDILATDGDNDGQQELYVLRNVASASTRIDRYSFHDSDWFGTSIPLGPRAAYDLMLHDLDRDDKFELYAVDEDGRVLQVRWIPSAWFVTTVAQVGSGDELRSIATGDNDGDGTLDAIVAGSSRTGACCPPVNAYIVEYAGSAPPPPPPPPAFDATFSQVRGNEWWEQVHVATGTSILAKVELRLNGGDWKPMTQQSWGWSAGLRAVDGTIVQFRATANTGATDLSDCYRWIPPSNADATKVACPGGTPPPPPPPPPTGFDATFGFVTGNEWWVQAKVSPNSGHTIAKVEVRLNGGAWQPLAKQSWGPTDYAASYHIVEGTKVQFRATSGAGAADVSGCYRWIPPSGGFAATIAC
ncbi:MAG: hypothetical protein QOD77_122 [Thermoplasmata archaeon]|jgi:hypothetical protein|nr:hypothetical protein [Thermoplasmata archaeon]